MDASNAPWIVTSAISLLAAGGGFWGWLTARSKLKASPPAELSHAEANLVDAAGRFVKALGESQQKHADELRQEIRGQASEIAELRAEVKACDDRHAQCETDLGRERLAREALSAQVDELMRGRIAGYGEQPPLPGLGR